MPYVARIRCPRHARHNSLPRVFSVGVDLCRTAVTRGEKLPLLQRKVRELVNADEQKLRALVLINIALVAAVAEARGRAIVPGDEVLRGVVTLVPRARHVPLKVG